jgi:plasmid stabilization system protein ParE
MSKPCKVRLARNFETNLEAIELFLAEQGNTEAFDSLVTTLAATVIPNLERFPLMGRLVLERPIRSVEVANSSEGVQSDLAAISSAAELREYLLSHYLLLYMVDGEQLTLLSIRHHRQLSFDLQAMWLAE